MIQLNLRYTWADIFWFTFFHEAAHVLEHETTRVFVDLSRDKRVDDSEAAADQFSSDLLIPRTDYQTFVGDGLFTGHAVREFAAELSVHPGIVVGRLQHDGHLRRNRLNSFRNRLKFVSSSALED